jgi:hypothetical protein
MGCLPSPPSAARAIRHAIRQQYQYLESTLHPVWRAASLPDAKVDTFRHHTLQRFCSGSNLALRVCHDMSRPATKMQTTLPTTLLAERHLARGGLLLAQALGPLQGVHALERAKMRAQFRLTVPESSRLTASESRLTASESRLTASESPLLVGP